jgi:1-acyl-sn-glycerol-3-phosphate acyltransferase
MLEFSDKPYQYFPPRRSEAFVRALRRYNRLVHLPRKHLIDGVEVAGGERLASARRDGDSLLIVPNHPTHSDPQILLEALGRLGVPFQIMAAYDVFLRSKAAAFVMPRLGCFSVDREGSDAQAMKQASATLSDGGCALVMCPEGNVYLQNDRVTPFHDGAALLGLKAARELAKWGRRVLAVPVSIKVTHVTDARERVRRRLIELAPHVNAGPPRESLPDALRDIGVGLLRRNFKRRGLDEPRAEGLDELLRAAAEAILTRLESQMSLKPKAGEEPIERVRRARRAIHQIRIDPQRSEQHAPAAKWADEAMGAFRLLTYSGEYVYHKPTLDRVTETAEKLHEDTHGLIPRPLAPRRAYVRIGEPIDLGTLVERFADDTRGTVSELTDRFEAEVQRGIDEINAGIASPGAKVVAEPRIAR